MEALFSVGEPATERKAPDPPHRYEDWDVPVRSLYPTNALKTNKLEILSKRIGRETVRKGGWRSKEVVLVIGARGAMTRIAFKKKCSGVGLHCSAKGKVEREGEHLRVTLKQNASKEWERIDTGQVSAWVRRVE